MNYSRPTITLPASSNVPTNVLILRGERVRYLDKADKTPMGRQYSSGPWAGSTAVAAEEIENK
jgi:hypothetical protein